MGRDLLAEDYMLKQITASLIYPEGEVGKKFWKYIYSEAVRKYGTTNIAVNTFNKVWIVPDKAVVYENAKAGTAYVVEAKLKVMLEEDYLSMSKHVSFQKIVNNSLGSQILREIVIPQLTIEVNENKNFAPLRQVYNSLILATWYKKKIKESILSRVYADKNKVAGVNISDPKEKERIYKKYLRAFKKGVFNFIKEDLDPTTQEIIPRKYFSGGLFMGLSEKENTDLGMSANFQVTLDKAMINRKDFLSYMFVVTASVMTGSVAALVQSPNLPKEAETAVVAVISALTAVILIKIGIALGRNNKSSFYHNLGIALEEAAKNKEAAEAYRKAIEFAPKASDFYYSLGIVLSKDGKKKEAADAFREAIKLNRKEPRYYDRLGSILLKDGKNKEAADAFREAVKLNPKESYYHNNLDIALLKAEQHDESIEPSGENVTIPHASFSFEIGDEFTSHGHKINGGVSHGREAAREEILADYDKDQNVKRLHNMVSRDVELDEISVSERTVMGSMLKLVEIR